LNGNSGGWRLEIRYRRSEGRKYGVTGVRIGGGMNGMGARIGDEELGPEVEGLKLRVESLRGRKESPHARRTIAGVDAEI